MRSEPRVSSLLTLTDQPDSLEKVSIFHGLSADRLENFTRRCDWRNYKPCEQIIHYHDTSDEVFFLVAGRARVTIYSVDGRIISFRELTAGDFFGEYPAIDGGPRSASVEARTDCRIASASARAFTDLLKAEPNVAQALMRTLVQSIRGLTNRVYEFSTLAVNNRIQAELLRLARVATHDDQSARIEPAPTHADIASRISTHREAVTRELNRLSKIGIIQRDGNALQIKDVGRLAMMVHEATGE